MATFRTLVWTAVHVNGSVSGMDMVAPFNGGATDLALAWSALTGEPDADPDATDEEIASLLAQSQKRSAVYDIITNPTDVRVEVV